MLKYELQETAGHWIGTTAKAFERAVNEELGPHGITWRQCQVLCYLAMEGRMTQVDLAHRMNVEPPTVVGVLDRMERDSLIARSDCATDRRRKFIAPLPKAEAVWETILACAKRVRARAERNLSRQQLDTLRELLQTVQANLAAESAPADKNTK
jgi:MarR family transcriptional regulator for hemolysin